MIDSEIKDLTKLACDRARSAVALVTQLTDDEEIHTAILLSVGMHFIEGAAFHYQLAEDDVSLEEATAKILMALIAVLTKDKGVHKALAENLRGRL